MKTFISFLVFLLFTQSVYAAEYPPNEETIKRELGLKYYELRKQLPYDEGRNFSIDEALTKKEQVLNILLRLLNDKTMITTKKGSLFENLNINSPMSRFYENQFVIRAIIDLLVFSNGYESYPKAISDHFNKFGAKDKQIINSMANIQYKYYSMLYQKENNMQPRCADVFAKLVFEEDHSTREANKRSLESFKKMIDDGCIYIGVLSHYTDALIQDGKFNNSMTEAANRMEGLYNKYFDKLSDNDLNQLGAVEFLQKLAVVKENEGHSEFVLGINKKVAKLISTGRLRLEKKPQWFRVHYIWLLSKTLNARDKDQIKQKDEIIGELKGVIRKKGNVFILKDEEIPKDLSSQEKEFLKLIEK